MNYTPGWKDPRKMTKSQLILDYLKHSTLKNKIWVLTHINRIKLNENLRV